MLFLAVGAVDEPGPGGVWDHQPRCDGQELLDLAGGPAVPPTAGEQ